MFRKLKPKPVRSLNVYIFTDGIWQPECDLKPLIRRVVNKLKGNEPYKVGIQFISFGEDARGLESLETLDDFLDREE